MRGPPDPGSPEAYGALRAGSPELFDPPGLHGPGAIETLSDPAEVAAAQDAARRHRAARGLPADDVRVGLLARDPYLTVLRDPVRFPDGSLGLYNRIVEGRCVAAVAVRGGRIVVLRIFRHGIRRWSLEFPRGGRDEGETAEEAVRREVREEIGGEPTGVVHLGEFTPGGSILATVADLYFVEVDRIGRPDPAEGISGILELAVPEVEAMIRDGRIIDGFTMAAFLRARLAGLV